MACCVLAALIISHILAIWRDRRRIALYAAGLLLSVGLLGWQIDAHAQHIREFIADTQAILRGEDPAVAALQRSGLDCRAEADRKPMQPAIAAAK